MSSDLRRDLTPLEHALYTAMSDVSETLYAAGWMKDTEHALWCLVNHGGTWGMGCACTVADALGAIKALAEQTGTWIAWDDGPVAVPLDRWRELHAAHEDEWAAWLRGYVARGGPEEHRAWLKRMTGSEEGIGSRCVRCNEADDAREARALTVETDPQ